MTLNGWQRLGIIVSASWFVVGFCVGMQVAQANADAGTWSYAACINTDNPDFAGCNAAFQMLYAAAIAQRWQLAWLYALMPIFAGWFLAWLSIPAVRWIQRGFSLAKQTPSA